MSTNPMLNSMIWKVSIRLRRVLAWFCPKWTGVECTFQKYLFYKPSANRQWLQVFNGNFLYLIYMLYFLTPRLASLNPTSSIFADVTGFFPFTPHFRDFLFFSKGPYIHTHPRNRFTFERILLLDINL